MHQGASLRFAGFCNTLTWVLFPKPLVGMVVELHFAVGADLQPELLMALAVDVQAVVEHERSVGGVVDVALPG